MAVNGNVGSPGDVKCVPRTYSLGGSGCDTRQGSCTALGRWRGGGRHTVLVKSYRLWSAAKSLGRLIFFFFFFNIAKVFFVVLGFSALLITVTEEWQCLVLAGGCLTLLSVFGRHAGD